MKYKINNEESIYCDKIEYRELFEKIKDNNFVELKKLKDNQRSVVSLVEIEGKKFVLKRPVEKLERYFQRILTIMCRGESKKEFDGCKKVLKFSFKGPEPIMVWEKKQKNQIIDSYFLMSYIEGEICKREEMEKVRDVLYKIHEKGFYHGDAQRFNFMLTKTKEVYVIDTKLKKDVFGIGKIWDFIELQKNTNFKNFYFEKKWYYKIFSKLEKRKEKIDYYIKNIRRRFL